MDSAAAAGMAWGGMDIGHLLALVLILILAIAASKEIRRWFGMGPNAAPPAASPVPADQPIGKKEMELMVERLRSELREDIRKENNALAEKFGGKLDKHDDKNDRDFKEAEENNNRRFAEMKEEIKAQGRRIEELSKTISEMRNNAQPKTKE